MSSSLNSVQKTLALNIKSYRKCAELSQEALAYEADIDRTYISQLERALVNPSLAVLVRVACVLGVEVVDLLSDRSNSSVI